MAHRHTHIYTHTSTNSQTHTHTSTNSYNVHKTVKRKLKVSLNAAWIVSPAVVVVALVIAAAASCCCPVELVKKRLTVCAHTHTDSICVCECALRHLFGLFSSFFLCNWRYKQIYQRQIL